MRTRRTLVAGVMLMLSTAVAQADEQQPAATPSKSPAWSERMRGLYKTLSDLLTDVSSSKRFNDPANAYRIENEVNKVASLTHDLTKKGMVVPDLDPTVQIVAGMLAEQAKGAAAELKRGNRGYARVLIRSIPGYCIACHTRNPSGPEFSKLPLEPNPKEGKLSHVELGEFYAATRQFDRAQDEFIEVINSTEAAKNLPIDWSRAVHDSLAIAVRVKQNTDMARQVATSVLNTPAAPIFERQDAEQWRVSIEDWQQELPRIPKTEAGLYSEMLRLMAKAHDTQKYPADRSGDVYYLRASSIAHDLLQMAPNGQYADQALLMAGICYEVLSPVGLEDLHQIYYEACIRRSPHTPTAEMCYRRYEQSTFFDYTGSAGLDIPFDVREKLLELGGMAKAVKNIQK